MRDETTTFGSVEPLPVSAVLAHHWLVRIRGGEKVLESLADLVPHAPLYTLVHDSSGIADSPLAGRKIHPSFLRHVPGATRHYPRLLPLLPLAARRMHLPEVDLVLCSDAAIAKAMRPAERSAVVVYCHSPMRYAYEPEFYHAYREGLPRLARPVFDASVAWARSVDVRAARRVDRFVANSHYVAARIQKAYGREAAVVYPPVEVPAQPTRSERQDFYLSVGFHTAYKRLDLAIEACRALGRRLVVIGGGPEAERLRPKAPANVEILGWQPDDVIQSHLERARGLLFPGEEDFGIVPVEAFARGCPVVAYGVGGATESVKPGVCGIWFDRQTSDAVAAAMESLERTSFDPERMHEEALRFGPTRFLREMRALVETAIQEKRRLPTAPPRVPKAFGGAAPKR